MSSIIEFKSGRVTLDKGGRRHVSRGPLLATGLTAKQEAFVQAYAGGMSMADAYRHSHDCSRSKQKTIYEAAVKLAVKDRVKARIDAVLGERRKNVERVAARSHERWYNAVWHIAENGDSDAARVAALRELARAIGIGEDRLAITSGTSAKELETELKAKLAKLCA